MVMDGEIKESREHLIAEESKKLHLLLQQTHNEALIRNEMQITRWLEYRKEHEELSGRLLTLRDSLSHEIMVPLGKKALMRGRLVHTNEILVCLGDGWFAKTSANQAADICLRRIKHCDEMLKELHAEKDLLTSRKSFPHEVEAFGEGQTQELIEPYNEEEENKWRERHRQKEREYRQKLAKIQQSQKSKIETEEDLWKRLDELDKQEEIEDEINRLDSEEDMESTEDESSNEDGSASERESDQSSSLKSVKKETKITRRVSFKVEPADNDEKTNEDISLSDENLCTIVFRHSDNKPVPVSSEAGLEITSPAELYREYLRNRVPKSILKASSSLEPFPSTSVDPIQTCMKRASAVVMPSVENSAKEAIMRDVVEAPSEVWVETTSRPVSRFKAARLASKR